MSQTKRSRRSGRAVDLLTCSLTKFAAAVRAVVTSIGDDEHERFGPRKVFIGAVYGALVAAGYRVGAQDDFKARLVLAKAAGLLELARADLVAAMPRDAVTASEIAGRWETHHFVIDRAAGDFADRGVAVA